MTDDYRPEDVGELSPREKERDYEVVAELGNTSVRATAAGIMVVQDDVARTVAKRFVSDPDVIGLVS